MAGVIRVEFDGPARHQYCSVPAYALRRGDVVVVETDWGVGMGDVRAVLETLSPEEPTLPLRPILRKATPIDLSRRAILAQREREAGRFCRERIEGRGLPMKLAEVRIGLDSSKAMFYFTAEGRVDFRELVKDLIHHLRTRVELRQIGVRDEARVLGSAGPCGRSLCCRSFLQAFAPVSIRMAKDQNLALNPGKLSGMCGRLKCCLAFEHPLYADLKRALPKVGCCVATCQGLGLVRAQNILDQTVVVGLETGGQVTLKAAEFTVRPRSDLALRRHAPGDPSPGGPATDAAGGGRSKGEPVEDAPGSAGRDSRGPEVGSRRPGQDETDADGTRPPGEAGVPVDAAALEDG